MRPSSRPTGAAFDPRIRARIESGAGMRASDLVALHTARRAIIADMAALAAPYDAVAMPTAPILPPPIDSLGEDAEYLRQNNLTLRNTSLANFLDRCAISLPAHRPGEPPVGFMLMGEHGGDARLFALAAAIESAIGPGSGSV